MAKKQVKNLYLDEYIETECSGGIIGDYLPLSGGTISGNVNIDNAVLSVNSIAIGKDNIIGEAASYSLLGGISSICNGSEQIAFGRNCIAGAKGYKILAANELTSGIVSLSIDTTSGPISEEIIGLQHSVDITNAATNVGEVLSVNNTTSEILVDKSYRYSSGHSYNEVLSNRTIYFIDKPLIGNITYSTGNYSVAEGYYTRALGSASHAEGGYTVAAGTYAHTEGKNTMASWGAHAEGCANRSFGECSHTQGRVNIAKGAYSATMGSANITDSNAGTSLAAGYLSHAKDKCTFVWNGEKKYGYQGDPSKEYSYIGAGAWRLNNDLSVSDQNAMDYIDSDIVLSSMYESHGSGTFNINPEKGLSGFYIGEKNLHDILNEYNKMPDNIKPLAGKKYTSSSPLGSMIIDIIQALGGEYQN